MLRDYQQSTLRATTWTEADSSPAGLHPINFRRTAVFMDKIFKGTKAGELPVELPCKIYMVVNSKRPSCLV